MAEELLKLENIYKNFGNVKVLKDVNIKINKGEVVALIGDNGAGKSTLIKVITGVHTPNSGKVFFKEKEVQIIMTLTSPSCPVAESLPEEVKLEVEKISGVKSAKVEITFEPPWNKSMMSEEAKLELGFM